MESRKGTATTCGDVYFNGSVPAYTATPWNAQIIIPITTTIGVSTVVDIQWMRQTADNTSVVTVLNSPTSQPDFNHRSLIIME